MTPDTWAALARANPTEAGRILKEVRSRIITPHAGGQREVDAATDRFIWLRAGRRWGKTQIGARRILRAGLEDPGMYWWIGNLWKNTRRGYKAVREQCPPGLLSKPAPMDTSSELALWFKNGTRIEFYSAESPESMLGEGVKGAVCDEAAKWREAVWTQHVRPTLMDYMGWALFISTPQGKNWFHDGVRRAERGRTGHRAFHFPSATNPYLAADEIEEMRDSLPALLFAQEVMAEFVDNAASIFKLGREGAVVPELVRPAGRVVMGVDLAKKEDFTVITASNSDSHRPCFHERFNELSWPTQKDAIKVAVQYCLMEGADHVELWMDATTHGDVLLDELREEGLDANGIAFSAPWKRMAVTKLAADLEQGRAHILEEQRPEFESFEYEISPAGTWKFHAASGHDDEVDAKLLEHWGMEGEGSADIDEVDLEEPDDEEDREPITADSPADIMARPEAWV